MKTERELLELAAKACGIRVKWEQLHGVHWVDPGQGLVIKPWNPLKDDGDCARMEARIRVDIEWQRIGVVACHRAESGHDIVAREPYADHQYDRQSARRMASLMVAAAIQEAKEAP